MRHNKARQKRIDHELFIVSLIKGFTRVCHVSLLWGESIDPLSFFFGPFHSVASDHTMPDLLSFQHKQRHVVIRRAYVPSILYINIVWIAARNAKHDMTHNKKDRL